MSTQRFRTFIRENERGRVFVLLPFDPPKYWGPRALYRVRGTIAGHPFEGRLSTGALRYWFSLNDEFLARTGLGTGDDVEVEITPFDPPSK